MSDVERLYAILEEKVAALIVSGKSFDQGQTWEAKRLASEVWMLMHDGGRNARSLLGQLGLKESLWFVSSAPPPRQAAPSGAIPVMWTSTRMLELAFFVDGSTHLLPPCYTVTPLMLDVDAETWWHATIWEGSAGTMSRSDIVRSARDQDGGGHVDPVITAPHYGPVSWMAGGQDPEAHPNSHLLMLRQIGWEMEVTLRRAFGEDVSDPHRTSSAAAVRYFEQKAGHNGWRTAAK